jgi:excisionase family DNA binding protein
MRKTRKLNRSSERVPMMTTEQLLRWIPISERTLRRYLAAGKLRAYKMDGLLLFNPSDIEDFLKKAQSWRRADYAFQGN